MTPPNDPADALLCLIDRLSNIEQAPHAELDGLRGKLAARQFDLVVAGQFKRGKSSVINALVGSELLPVGVVPLTSVVTLLSYGTTTAAQIVFENGERHGVFVTDVAAYATERGNPKNAKHVAEVRITCPIDWLRSGIRLVDTPGVGSIYRHNTDVAWGFLPKADAVLLVLSVEQPLSAEERDFLAFIRSQTGKTFFLLNKTDLLQAADLHDALEFTRRTLADIVGAPARVFPVSARLALTQTENSVQHSGFPELRQALDEFLRQGRDTALHESAARQLTRLLAQARARVELERNALATPLDELRRKVAAFAAKKQEAMQTREDSALLLGKEAVRVWMDRLDAGLAAFRKELGEQLDESIARIVAGHSALSTRRLAALLERTVVDEIRAGYDGWRSERNQQLGQEFTAWCARHARQVDDSVDELFRFSAELFRIDYRAVRVETLWSVQSSFYYKFWSEPPSLRQLATALVLVLPRRFGHRLLRRRFAAFAHESVETQSGRTRYDFQQRLEDSVRDFRKELLARMETAIAGIESAVRSGTALRESGERASADRLRALRASRDALADIDAGIATAVDRPEETSWN
jgi:predicted GTPase